VLEIARAEPRSLAAGLEAIARTLAGYVSACIQHGADDIFTRRTWQHAITSRNRTVLAGNARMTYVSSRPHRTHRSTCCTFAGKRRLSTTFVDYPVAAFSWAAGQSNPSLREGHLRTGKASIFCRGVLSSTQVSSQSALNATT